jgi:hypothetical protein
MRPPGDEGHKAERAGLFGTEMPAIGLRAESELYAKSAGTEPFMKAAR